MTARGSLQRRARGRPRESVSAVVLATVLGARAAVPGSALVRLDLAGRSRVVSHLQRTAGNAAVQRLLATQRLPVGRLVQRDQVFYDTRRALTWADYQGKVPRQRGLDALTHAGRTGLKVAWDAAKSGKEWTATASIEPTSLNLRAFVDTSRSWARRAQTSEALLRHEQGHFDIENVLVEKGELAVRAAAKDVTGTGTARSRRDAIDAAVADLKQSAPFATIDLLDGVIDRAHNDYDEDPVIGTDHGTRTAQQAQWQAEIRNDLPAYPIR
jgi:hypothetical protein